MLAHIRTVQHPKHVTYTDNGEGFCLLLITTLPHFLPLGFEILFFHLLKVFTSTVSSREACFMATFAALKQAAWIFAPLPVRRHCHASVDLHFL